MVEDHSLTGGVRGGEGKVDGSVEEGEVRLCGWDDDSEVGAGDVGSVGKER